MQLVKPRLYTSVYGNTTIWTADSGAVRLVVKAADKSRRIRELQQAQTAAERIVMAIPDTQGDLYSSRANASPAAKMPTRFGVGLMLMFLSLFSLGFFVLTALRVPGQAILYLSLLFAAVAAAQVLWPSSPRWASSMTGALLTPLYLAACAIWEIVQGPEQQSVGDVLRDYAAAMIGFLPFTALLGAFFGYLAGTLLAGLFLRIGLRVEDSPPTVVAAELSTPPSLSSQPEPEEGTASSHS